MTLGLLDMPEIVMSKIIKDADFKAIFILRKVCHDLQNFIDDVKPDAKLERIRIDGGCKNSNISVIYQFSITFPWENHHVTYNECVNGCFVKNMDEGNEILLKNEDFVTVCMKDFEIILRHQKSILKQFDVSGRSHDDIIDAILFEKLQRILKSRVYPLKVETLSTISMNQNQILSVLPFLDSKTLIRINILNLGQYLEIDQLVKLDQWRNIKNMTLDCCVDIDYIRHFTHLTTDEIHFVANHLPDLVSLKNLFLQSSGFQIINIRLTTYDSNDIQKSSELLGEPIILSNSNPAIEHKWYYRIPATKEVVEIYVIDEIEWINKEMRIKLSRIEEDDVPRNTVIHN